MGTITVNISDETEHDFRETVEKTLGKGKGVLGKAITEALTKWVEEDQEERARNKLMTLMEHPLKLNMPLYKRRSELYERRTHTD